MAGLTRRDGSSLHHQLYSILQSGILSGRFPNGSLLPSEDALAETYQVSRATVRRAMQTLERKGGVKRLHGVGTRVEATDLSAPRSNPSVMNLINAMGDESELVMLRFEFVRCPPEVAEGLDLSSGDTVLHISRLRQVDGIPFRLTHHFLPEAIGRKLTPEMIERQLLVAVLATLGIVAHRADNLISAILADADDADLLSVDVGAPMLDLKRVVRSEDGKPFLLQHAITPAEREKLFIETGSSARPIVK
jgi:GntR family transcriptional regulator